MLTPSIPEIDEPHYEMVAELSKEFISKFLKAKKALDTNVFTVEQGYDIEEKPALKFTLGGLEKYTNKINFTLPTQTSTIPGNTIKFPLNEFSEVLAANKEFKTGTLNVSEEGLIKISFENEEGVKTSYLLVGIE
jgi:hypothetical protein